MILLSLINQEKNKLTKHINIPPGRNLLKYLVVQSSFFCLGRAFQSASLFDKDLQKEISAWDNLFTIMLKVHPHGPCLILQKINNKIRFIGLDEKYANRETIDLTMVIKNIASAYMLMTMQVGNSQAAVEHRFSMVKGDTIQMMRYTRCLNIIVSYLLPSFVARKIIRKLPKMTLRKHMNRFLIYTFGLVFGIK